MRHPLPFSPGYAFVATRVIALNGRVYQAGETIDKTDLSGPRLRQLYEGRKIAPVIPEPVVEPAKEAALDVAEEVAEDAPAVAEEPVVEPARLPAKPKRKG